MGQHRQQHYPLPPHHQHHHSATPNRSPSDRRRFPDGSADDGCLARTPLASLSAFLCCLVGVLLFAIMMAWAFTASVEQARRALRVTNLPWLDKVHLLFLVSAGAMVAVSLAFLLVGLLSTGPTRHAVFSGGRRISVAEGGDDCDTAAVAARRGGRISCVVAICLSFVLNLLWTTIAMVTAILCFFYTILYLLCSSANDCLDFGVFGSLFNKQNNNNRSLSFCGGELQQLCAVTNTVIVWYFVGLLGSVVVCVGLVQFIATNAANYAHIGSEAKYAELKHLFYSEINSNDSTMPLEQFSIDERRQHHYQQQQALRRSSNANGVGGGRRPDCDNNKWDAAKEAVVQQRHASARNAVHPPPYEYRPTAQIERRADRRSVGATLASVRRNSYQTSLHGSNNWLNF